MKVLEGMTRWKNGLLKMLILQRNLFHSSKTRVRMTLLRIKSIKLRGLL